MRIGIALGDDEARVATVHRETGDAAWKRVVLAGSLTMTTELEVTRPGPQRLRLYLVNPGWWWTSGFCRASR